MLERDFEAQRLLLLQHKCALCYSNRWLNRLQAMFAMAQEGWLPTVELWTEPGTLKDTITPIKATVVGAENDSFTVYTCNGFTDKDILEFLSRRGYACTKVWHAVLVACSSICS